MRDTNFGMEAGHGYSKFDDDGRIKRTGTLMTTSAHIVTAVIGSGVLSLAWALAQLGWIAGPISLVGFSLMTWFTSILLADCYRNADGTRNYTYMDVVKSNLGGMKIQLCGIAQYSNLIGVTIGYSITTSISMVAIKRSNCFHKHGQQEGCHEKNNDFIILFGVIQIILSQIPNFHKLSVLSLVAAVMSFAYSSIGIALSIAKIAGGDGHAETGLTGIPVGENQSSVDKMWNTFSAFGNIAFAYAFSNVLIEIQDTVKSGQPENTVMKKATLIAISISTLFYMLCGIGGYAAFGNKAPGNFLTGFGFYNPFWLVDLANVCIVVHLLGAYQVFCQPIFGFIEKWSNEKWARSKFITKEYPIGMPFCGNFNFSFFRLIWRTTYVIFTTVLAMLFPFFNDFVGLLGAASFWPLTVYFPIEMYISKAKIPKFSFTWIWMQILSLICFTISLLAAAGSVRGLIKSLQTFKPFNSVS
ncbi:amino acid permease 6-like [Olea europaea subsp. europaea]|uniref:Amino acid permease 6-like n=1 Tax=Olea europaea subsp. europaea TaxID=158383 RepID=A0A8S0V3Q6_OLEEU|nr:amino acid permease 6-like [Olea europaea subsp. europaea]